MYRWGERDILIIRFEKTLDEILKKHRGNIATERKKKKKSTLCKHVKGLQRLISKQLSHPRVIWNGVVEKETKYNYTIGYNKHHGDYWIWTFSISSLQKLRWGDSWGGSEISTYLIMLTNEHIKG
jgi:hypothetical protein